VLLFSVSNGGMRSLDIGVSNFQHSNSDGKSVSIDMIEQQLCPPSYLYLDAPTPAAIGGRKDEIAKQPMATLTIQ
jgi:hypothetical protein